MAAGPAGPGSMAGRLAGGRTRGPGSGIPARDCRQRGAAAQRNQPHAAPAPRPNPARALPPPAGRSLPAGAEPAGRGETRNLFAEAFGISLSPSHFLSLTFYPKSPDHCVTSVWHNPLPALRGTSTREHKMCCAHLPSKHI